ncbi:amine oxidase, partial [Lysobacter sp. 2RAB21]
NTDRHILELIEELGENSNVLLRPTRTGMYYADQFFRLSTPLDLLRFKALPFLDRIRLGVAVLRARSVKDWSKLEHLSAKEWLIDLCGQRAYDVVWDPLLTGKFGSVAEDVSAVWFWKKLVLRGGSRSSSGDEVLAYYKGGFAALAERLEQEIKKLGGEVRLRTAALRVIAGADGRATGVETAEGMIEADNIVLTTAL